MHVMKTVIAESKKWEKVSCGIYGLYLFILIYFVIVTSGLNDKISF